MVKSKGSSRVGRAAYVVFGVYVALLVWLVLFKLATNIGELPHLRSVNLIPFQGVHDRLRFKEMFYNVLIFVPLGVYVGIFKPDWTFFRKVLPGFGLSLAFEVLQFVFTLGASDVTDLIGNTLGGVLGLALYKMLQIVFKRRSVAVVNVLGAIIEIFALVLLGILLIVNR
jgi:glycopeptide antibiotics resistance protein